MVESSLEALFERLRASAVDELLDALFELRRRVPALEARERAAVADAVSSLFYLDVNDRPELNAVIDQAVRLVHALGAELIPTHLQEMRGSDFKALFCFARVLALFGAEAVGPIIEACRDTGDSHLLVGGIYALTKIRHSAALEALPLILEQAASPDSEVRDTAVRAVGKLVEHQDPDRFDTGRREAVFDILLRSSHDAVPAVRAKAVRGLGKLAHRGWLDSARRSVVARRLALALGEDESEPWDQAFIVRREAKEARESLGG